MDKVYYNKSDLDFLLEWRDNHKALVRMGLCPIKAIKIISLESGLTLTCIRKGNIVKISATILGRNVGSVVFEYNILGFYSVIKSDAKKLKEDDVQSIATVYASTMAIMSFGGQVALPEKEKKQSATHKTAKSNKKSSTNKNKSSGITYILKRQGNDAQLVRKGSHARPEGTFSVRGHFRHYKNGRVIWIAEYVKGSGKDTYKNYRL